MIYTLKQFAEMFNTTEHTIRYYTDINLLPCRSPKTHFTPDIRSFSGSANRRISA
ncbi:MAG TPA: MerR family transcriptional regulator [Candidatus Scybalocola faecipullorum]|nr:MerR family transcriptional regulator [Candidatus Scybalocola faecipullorum]